MSDLLALRAGPLLMDFDVQNAFLRYLRLGRFEILRGIFAAVRDRDWNTIPTTVSDFAIEQSETGFELSFLAKCQQGDVDFNWRGHLIGTERGEVSFHFAGEALSTFEKNRIGLCVLHPSRACAGKTCRVEHCDGTTSAGVFPRHISPHQPFMNIRAVSHHVSPGVEARVHCHGDVFEMEDQRNWTDASFKTYCTPLDLPFPVEIAIGSRINQTVSVEILSSQAEPLLQPDNTDSDPVLVNVAWDLGIVPPPIGFSMSTNSQSPTEAAVDRMRSLRPSHLRVELRLSDPQWMATARDAIDLAKRIGCRLEVSLHSNEAKGKDWHECLSLLDRHRDLVARWLIFDPQQKSTPASLASDALQSLRAAGWTVPLVVGTNAYFAELNRNRPVIEDSMQVCYSINPQVHAFDNLSLCETLEAQRETVDSAFAIFGCPIVVSPITLRPRFNPNATSADKEVGDRNEPVTDLRQSTGYAAAWTTGVLGQLATHERVASMTCYETWGPRGVMDLDGESFPMSVVFAEVLQAKTICDAVSSRPLDVTAIGLFDDDGRRRVMIGNMSGVPRDVIVDGSGGLSVRHTIAAESVVMLDVEGAE